MAVLKKCLSHKSTQRTNEVPSPTYILTSSVSNILKMICITRSSVRRKASLFGSSSRCSKTISISSRKSRTFQAFMHNLLVHEPAQPDWANQWVPQKWVEPAGKSMAKTLTGHHAGHLHFFWRSKCKGNPTLLRGLVSRVKQDL